MPKSGPEHGLRGDSALGGGVSATASVEGAGAQADPVLGREHATPEAASNVEARAGQKRKPSRTRWQLAEEEEC